MRVTQILADDVTPSFPIIGITRLYMFFLFYVLVFKFFLCCWRLMYVFVFLIKVTEWPPIGKIAAHSAYDMFHGISA